MGIIHLALSFSDNVDLIPKGAFNIIYYRLLQVILFCYSEKNRD
jgi:hypothetical protein